MDDEILMMFYEIYCIKCDLLCFDTKSFQEWLKTEFEVNEDGN